MKKSKKRLATLLALLLVLCTSVLGISSASAATAAISYSFAENKAGFAEGTITVTPTAGNYGNYYLYWADDTKALEGYREIAALNIASGSGTYTMLEHTVIPADATNLIAIKSSTEPLKANRTVAKADAVYSIPLSRQLDFASSDALYTFGAISDPQLANDSYGSGSYPNDETHLAAAFDTMNSRNVDFIVSSGDTVNDQNGNQTYAAEYKRYQRILADSFYANPIYEANGNHDVGTVWNKNGGYYNIDDPFVIGTGLDSAADTINSGKPYFEITEPVTGDHFIFMALEGGFYTDRGTQFSKEQLDWLEGLLKKYSTDGKNIFIIEHANIQGWGSGDKLTTPYYYDLGLNRSSADVQRFIGLMETYKECVIISGHTHLELSAHLNYSDNNGTSAVMMHNSAVGGVRRLINGKVDRTAVLGMSEGYIVDVFEDCIIFNGANLYYDEIIPDCSYIIPFDTEAIESPTEPDTQPTETIAPEITTTAPDNSTAPTEPDEDYLWGDADLSGEVNIKDATAVQKFAADMLTFDEKAFIQANVSGDAAVNVRDATAIQKFIAGLITEFPVQKSDEIAEIGAIAPQYEEALKYLDTYYMYSSYDQYMALKRATTKGDGSGDFNYTVILPQLEKELEDFILSIGGELLDIDNPQTSSEITVYFVNNYNWSEVNAYVWGSAGSMSTWPGSAMTYVTTNGYDQKVYSVTFSYEDYQNIIFNDGSKQTVDIALENRDNAGYYISGESGGKYTCDTYTFSN